MKKLLKALVEFLRRAFATPPVPPPTPQPTPLDAIPIQQIAWNLPFNMTSKITATLKDIKITLPQTISWTWTHPPWVRWAHGLPNPEGVCGTMWVMAKVNNIWYAAGWEWLLPETSISTTEAFPGQPPFIQAKCWPFDIWYPKSGEEVGFMVSTISPGWDGPATHQQSPERSPIVVVRWP